MVVTVLQSKFHFLRYRQIISCAQFPQINFINFQDLNDYNLKNK